MIASPRSFLCVLLAVLLLPQHSCIESWLCTWRALFKVRCAPKRPVVGLADKQCVVASLSSLLLLAAANGASSEGARHCAGGEPRTLCEVLSHVEPHVQHTPAFVITFVLKVRRRAQTAFSSLKEAAAGTAQLEALQLRAIRHSMKL